MTPETLRRQFLGWQCRLRQIAMREDGGRPSEGMRPKVLSPDGRTLSEGTVVLLVRTDPAESSDFFEFQVRKNHDPNEVYQKGLTFLQSTHYHRANRFSDEMTALFLPESRLAALLAELRGLSAGLPAVRPVLPAALRRARDGARGTGLPQHAVAQPAVQHPAVGRCPHPGFQAGLDGGGLAHGPIGLTARERQNFR